MREEPRRRLRNVHLTRQASAGRTEQGGAVKTKRTKRPKPFIRWMHKMKGSGSYLSLLYEEKELKRVRCQDRCDPVKVTKLVKVKVVEIA